MSERNVLRLAIGGMHCGACVNRVTLALGKLPGVEVRSVEIGSAQVDYDPRAATPEEIAAAVNRIGFTAKAEGN
jgi:copper chaperone CopZ